MSETSSLKACSACNESKPIGDFYLQSTNPEHRAYGRPQGRCKICVRAQTGDYQRRNRERASEMQWSWRLKNQYGIAAEDYRQMLDDQLGACAICGGPPEGGHGKKFHVDHCHATGRVRGLLCGLCNRGMGYLQDSPDLLLLAADYLTVKPRAGERCD
jgi:hypothetical protein